MQFFSIIRSTALYTDGIGCHYCYASAFQCIWYCALPSAYVTVAVLSAIGVLLAFVMLLRASARTPRIKTGNDDVVYMVLKAPFALHAGWAVVQVVLTANIWALYPDKMGADAIDNQLCVAIVSLVVLICAAIWGSCSQDGSPCIPLVVGLFLAAVAEELSTSRLRLMECAGGCKKPALLRSSLAYECRFGSLLCACMFLFCVVGMQNAFSSVPGRDRRFSPSILRS
jgi:hypothetical protein